MARRTPPRRPATLTKIPTTLRIVRVRALPGDRARGQLAAGAVRLPCALGRAGPRRDKREGDGASPVGAFRLRGGAYRPDRLVVRPRTLLPLRRTRPGDGWCDDPRDRRYNRPVPLPCGAGHERMWRGEDDLYDVVLDLDYNRGPIRRGRGSAIFVHVARPGFRPTEGCVALRRADLLRLLPRLGRGTRVVIAP